MIYSIIQRIKNLPFFKTFVRIGSFIFTLRFRIFKSAKVKFGHNFISHWKLRITGPGKVEFGDNVTAGAYEEWNTFITYSPEAQIKVGNNCRINGSSFQCQNKITVGNNCIIGSALLVDTDHHSIYPDRLSNPDSPVASKPITIGKNVWIAGRSAILKGVTIGDNSVIGFGSVVTSDIPANVIAAGNPAKVIKPLPETKIT